MKKFVGLMFSMVLLLSMYARADLTIEITQGVDNPTVIGIVPFGYSGARGLPEDIPGIVRADLKLSGQFRPIPVSDMLAFPRSEAEVIYRDWRILGAEFLVTGDIKEVQGRYTVTFELFDILGQRKLFRKSIVGSEAQLRDLAHYISDEVYEKITGIRGAFSTQVAYVEAFQQGKPTDRFRLMLADADGARPRLLLESKHPLMSPTWSTDGKRLAYVSFETGRAAIFVQDLATAKREQVTNYKGLNGAPAFSPDGTKLALVLSKDGNPEIYTLNLITRQFARVTQHFAIDTEPSWTPDGKSLVFTSNRGGKPQIYKVTLATGMVERLTFAGDYNARARVSPDGKSLVMVHRSNGVFHIATQDIQSGDLRILTETYLDESPSISPNGAMLMYATRFQNKGILAAVSLDAGVKFRLPSKQGDVREPAWSPFFD
ncbi:Tol-Pal system beta propeller repeat protein TolB [Simiduia litorea]